MNIKDTIMYKGIVKPNVNKFIIISFTESSGVIYDFKEDIDEKTLLSKIACSENSIDCEDLDKYSEYLSSFKKPYNDITINEFIENLNKTNHCIKYIIEVNKEKVIYRSKK